MEKLLDRAEIVTKSLTRKPDTKDNRTLDEQADEQIIKLWEMEQRRNAAEYRAETGQGWDGR
jgi:hypothetical protein